MPSVWRGDQLGSPVSAVWPSGFAALDAQLPGGGWPGHGLTEILAPLGGGTLEWRLLGPALRRICADGPPVVLVGPPLQPHPPGLRSDGIDAHRLVWVRADTPAERLWSAEQLIKAQACGALMVWLPQARAVEIRRLQVLAAGFDAPVFVCRPSRALRESSAAPLRLWVEAGLDWTLQVRMVKRKGPPLDGTLTLASVPGSLQALITPRLRQPSLWVPPHRQDAEKESQGHVVVRTPAPPEPRHSPAAH